MKLRMKITLCTLALTGTVMAALGYSLTQSNFDAALAQTREQAVASHRRQLALVSIECLSDGADGASPSALAEAAGAAQRAAPGDAFALVGDGYATLYSSLPQDVDVAARALAIQDGANTYRFLDGRDGMALVMASPLPASQDAWLVSAFDASPAFTQREAQLRRLWQYAAAGMALAAAGSWALSALLTRGIRRLSAASARIAGGDLSGRIRLRQDDEVGAAAQSFDRMADAVEKNVRALEASVHARDDFVAAFSHELKTPMTAMLGYADLLRSREVDDETRRRAADYIYHESRRLEVLSRRMLELMELGEKPAELAPVHLSAVLAAARRACRVFPEGAVHFVPAPDVWVRAEPSLLCDLVLNLVENAVHASDAGSEVRVEARRRPGGVCVCVSDRGRGIPPEELCRITEPFYMVDKSRARRAGGSGLGLALCARIAELHGTQLEFESRVGKGTRVRFALPECAAPEGGADGGPCEDAPGGDGGVRKEAAT